MSVDLEIKINKPISVVNLLDDSERTIRDLLQSEDSPTLKAERMVEGNREPLTSNDFATGSGMLLLGFEGLEDFATIIVVDIEELPTFPDEMEAGLHANVSATRSPLGYALAACVAVALARAERSAIVDDAKFWSPLREQTADDFARVIALDETYQSVSAAAEAMYRRMKELKRMHKRFRKEVFRQGANRARP